MLDALPTEVTITPEPVEGTECQIDEAARNDLNEAVARMKKSYCLKDGIFSIKMMPPQHVGLGSKTSLLLAALKAWANYSEVHPSDSELQSFSGRGGASGVGIHGFFRGGFIVDTGRPSTGRRMHKPSAAQRPKDVPLLAMRYQVKDDWRFTLLLPKGRKYAGRAEIEFFRRNAPIPAAEVREAVEITYHGIAPSILTGDIESLKVALKRLHRCGFKQRELRAQTEDVARLLAELHGLEGCAAGMSSMGPLIYVIAASGSTESRPDVLDCAAKYHAQVLARCSARNTGYSIL